MRRALLVRSGSVSEVPGPGSYRALSRCGHIGKLDSGGGTGQGQIGGEVDARVGVHRYKVYFSHRIRTTAIADDKGDGIGARSGIGNRGVLDIRGNAISEIPAPEDRTVGGIIVELNGERAATRRWVCRKSSDRGLRTDMGQTEQTEQGATEK